MSAFPSTHESKAICWPSGDQRGVPVSGPPMLVSCLTLVPSLSQTEISKLPERREAKTILLPSGEYCGPLSSCVEEISFTGASSRPLELRDGRRQIFPSVNDWVYASRFAWREIVGL